MLKIKVGTKEFEYLNSLETEEYYNGSSRRTLTVNCSSDAIGLDELNVLLTEDNLAGLVMTNTEGISVYKDVLAEMRKAKWFLRVNRSSIISTRLSITMTVMS